MKRVIKISAIIAGVAVGMVSSLCAEDVTLPYTFSAGETAKASEVNANFETLKNAVNSKNMPKVEWKDIHFFNKNVRESNTVVEEITLNCPTDGRVVVHFNGMISSTKGDVITLAATDSIYTSLSTSNCTSVYVESTNTNMRMNTFSHTRAYDVTAGDHDFYAIARNRYTTDGTGFVSVYGSLTVTFYPNQN